VRPEVRILIGIGNPGEEYETTRHNVGYRVAEELLRRWGRPYEERKGRSIIGRVRIEDRLVIVARPLTYMNRSGAAVGGLLEMMQAQPEELLVMCDDFHLDLGALRLRARGSHGGHNGLLSIIETIGSGEFPRLRVGIGPVGPGVAHADFVLAPFTRREEKSLPEVVGQAADCAETVVVRGMTAAMNRFNRAPHPDAVESTE
jgi:peptidyl-tRNA hydrolase, PTH1 family